MNLTYPARHAEKPAETVVPLLMAVGGLVPRRQRALAAIHSIRNPEKLRHLQAPV
ncbi:MAG: hypothetical protein M3P40_11975 [Actinomycetota bacterium]|nr:hypothetical protein [Actinomycetota bacterium]